MDVRNGEAVGYWSGQAEVQHVGLLGVMMCCQAESQPTRLSYKLSGRDAARPAKGQIMQFLINS